jgi:hypothetical protein
MLRNAGTMLHGQQPMEQPLLPEDHILLRP